MENTEIDSKINMVERKIGRSSNLELLRIFAIVMIIAHHYSVHGGWDIPNELSYNRIIVQLISLGGKLGVNCFILITGYFMINSKFNIKKFSKIIGQVFFYSVAIMLVFKLFGISHIGIRETAKSFFPIIFSKYWFATTYVELYILSPYLNKLINYCTEKEYQRLLIILIIILSVIPTFTNSLPGIDNLPWFVFLYLVASYIRKYQYNFFDRRKLLLLIFIGSYMLIMISVVIIDLFALKIPDFPFDPTFLREMNSLPMFICSISLFIYFKKLDMGSKKIINNISSTTFGIYLIHDNNLVRSYLWEHIAKNNSFYNSRWLSLHAIVTISLVFFICMIIEGVRINFIEKPAMKFLDKEIESKFLNKSRNYIDRAFSQHISN
ncbi:acyltransferase [Clostridium beijerinckii]|uniref:acyltransferase n=1 Tax=Clostridium beijerinckii TaxID=1520 RepID=UPI00232EBF28|nr:acyltransferase [Clostridium beijerinckii]